MIDDPAVRSVRVAVALSDRFVELLKGPSQVTARKQEGALIGVSGNQDDLSLRIGEAQQLYPEIWRHLDDARAAFAARGIDVAGYDAIRREEGQGLGAAVDTDYQKHGVGKYAVHEHVKSANFNQAGVARARRACDALMRATPEIDWAGIAKAEANDPHAAAFGRSVRTKRLIQFGLLGLVIAAPFLIVMYMQHEERAKAIARREPYRAQPAPAVQPLPEAERKELTASIVKLRENLATARKSWAASATPDGLKAIAPGTGPCPIAVQEPSVPATDSFIRTGDVDAKAFESSDFRAYVAGKIASDSIPDPELQQIEETLAYVERRVTDGVADASDRQTLANIASHWTTVIIDKDSEPNVTQTAPKITYKPGEVTARAYLFSLAHGKFVCAANITARNTPSEQSPKFLDDVRRAPDAEDRLHRELEVRIRQALAAGLKSVE